MSAKAPKSAAGALLLSASLLAGACGSGSPPAPAHATAAVADTSGAASNPAAPLAGGGARTLHSSAKFTITIGRGASGHASETSTSTVGNETPALPLSGRTITVDPGHDGGNFTHPQQIARLVPDGNGEKECDTTGTAAPDGYREADFNWSVAVRLRALLQAAGAKVAMTRSSNTGVGPCVNERAAIGNHAHSDAAISIHGDGGPTNGSGFAILLPAPIPSRSDQSIVAPSRRLGIDERSALLASGLHTSDYDGHDGLAPRTDLGGLNLSKVPKVFVEVANMQNRADEAPMEHAAFRERVARALLAGIERFLPSR